MVKTASKSIVLASAIALRERLLTIAEAVWVFFRPSRLFDGLPWRGIWEAKERRLLMVMSRAWMILASIAYLAHYFFLIVFSTWSRCCSGCIFERPCAAFCWLQPYCMPRLGSTDSDLSTVSPVRWRCGSSCTPKHWSLSGIPSTLGCFVSCCCRSVC